MARAQKMMPSGFAILRSAADGLWFMWNESVMATDTTAIKIDSRR